MSFILFVDTLTSVTTCVPSGVVYVFDVKSCPGVLLDGGLIRLFQSVELVKVSTHCVSGLVRQTEFLYLSKKDKYHKSRCSNTVIRQTEFINNGRIK